MSGPAAAARRDRLRARLAALDAPAALVTRLVNVRYLTGFTGSNGALLVCADGTDVLATDGRYITQSAQEAPDVERLIERRLDTVLAARAVAAGHTRLAYESHEVTVDGLAAVTAAEPGLGLVSLEQAVEDLRAVKDEAEIDLLRRACAIADEALSDLIAAGGVRAGRTEREVARDLDARMLDLGAEAVSFETIVASGPNSAIPHHSPGSRVIEGGDFVKCDFGATYSGYHSDMTRTLVIGGAVADWQREIYDLVADAQRLGREALAVDAECAGVDAAARDRIVDAGHGEHYTHGLGHGVGLEIHEAPWLGATAPGRLGDRMPVTVEPGVYLEGRGGVRIEDTLVVRPDGPELLTLTTKDLLIV
ncbi:MAG: peptidase M24 family protein [Pseudonocardiales bacterium]|nr:MAG: peptidase M24 family protein [Pseudonocardiales bacterium]